MPPKSKQAIQTKVETRSDGSDAASQLSRNDSSLISMNSGTSSLLVGSVASAASKAPLKASKAVIRERKIVFWTPVMIWPSGFAKVHKKEVV